MHGYLRKFLLKLLTIVSFFGLQSQDNPIAKNLFINSDIQLSIDYWNIASPKNNFHSSFKPYLSGYISGNPDSAQPFVHYSIKNFFLSKTLNEKPQSINLFNVQIHPVVDFSPGYDMLQNKPILESVTGSHIKLNINNDFTLAGTAFGGFARLPFFMDTAVSPLMVIPGYGRVYKGRGGYNVFDYNGYVSYSPHNNRYFNFQLGRDRHFIGDGYRSVLLSDFANPYPYFRINANIWNIQYHVWYTMMQDATGANSLKSAFQKKYGTFHYLSWNITNNFNIGVFENVIWRGTDTNQVRTFDINYLNPVIFFRPQEFAIGSPDNSFMGLNMNIKIAKCLKLYAQLGLDEFFLREIRARRGWWANKQAWQGGFNYINAFSIKGLNLQFEYNEVRPYTYTHGIVSQNYAHDGLPLAHPLGANFREFLTMINYRKYNYMFSAKGMLAYVGKDTLGTRSNMGQNIFLSYVTRPYEYGHKTTQGDKHTLLQSDVKFTWWLIPDMGARIEFGYIQQSVMSKAGYKLENPFFYLGFKTSFWNIYRDY